ncbi:phospholipid phosphatase 5 isoform X2 [Lingula anatina]|uniref:Phospholipid phosphatase 5 isoform X2 n=1 Tax=Lingula anatina TaxID=7574 RepID=A0A1S3H6Y5_LINAN|nr:phospholipid phosphatase 5 isoform X2 [Lingula anatina]|eukprot:XP_013381742.1 phospholipid phosphatase 5 isoform X2 [Lingula anatina]
MLEKGLQKYALWIEICVRLVIFGIFIITETAEPFHRQIQPEELWLYKNPVSESFVSSSALWIIISTVPTLVLLAFYIVKKDKVDFIQGALASLSIGLVGLVTNFAKLIIGRPRPDFFYRCFPDGISNVEMKCTGDPEVIIEGMKSFPSGHSSLSFSSLGLVSFYLCGKFHVFNARGRGQAWRMCISWCPLLSAGLIALSRTSDYHHHWQDVLVGSLLGFSLGYLCYRQYYPALHDPNSHQPYIAFESHLHDVGDIKKHAGPSHPLGVGDLHQLAKII